MPPKRVGSRELKNIDPNLIVPQGQGRRRSMRSSSQQAVNPSTSGPATGNGLNTQTTQTPNLPTTPVLVSSDASEPAIEQQISPDSPIPSSPEQGPLPPVPESDAEEGSHGSTPRAVTPQALAEIGGTTSVGPREESTTLSTSPVEEPAISHPPSSRPATPLPQSPPNHPSPQQERTSEPSKHLSFSPHPLQFDLPSPPPLPTIEVQPPSTPYRPATQVERQRIHNPREGLRDRLSRARKERQDQMATNVGGEVPLEPPERPASAPVGPLPAGLNPHSPPGRQPERYSNGQYRRDAAVISIVADDVRRGPTIVQHFDLAVSQNILDRADSVMKFSSGDTRRDVMAKATTFLDQQLGVIEQADSAFYSRGTWDAFLNRWVVGPTSEDEQAGPSNQNDKGRRPAQEIPEGPGPSPPRRHESATISTCQSCANWLANTSIIAPFVRLVSPTSTNRSVVYSLSRHLRSPS